MLASSPGAGCYFRFFSQNYFSDPSCVFVRISDTWWADSQRALFLLFLGAIFFRLFMFGAVWFHNRVPLRPDIMPVIVLMYDVLCTLHVFIQSAAAAAAALYVAILLLLLH